MVLVLFISTSIFTRAKNKSTTFAVGNRMISSLSGRSMPCTALEVTLTSTPRGPIGLLTYSSSNGFATAVGGPNGCIVAVRSLKGIPTGGAFALSRDGGIIGFNGLFVRSSARRLGRIAMATRGPLIGIRISGLACDLRSSPRTGADGTLRVFHGIPVIAISNRSGVRLGKSSGCGVCVGNGPSGLLDNSGTSSMLGDVPTDSVGGVRIVASPNSGCSTRKIKNVVGVVAAGGTLRKCAKAVHTGTDALNDFNNNNCISVGTKGFNVATGCNCGCHGSP